MSIEKKEIFYAPYHINHPDAATVNLSLLPLRLFHHLHIADGTYTVGPNSIIIPLNDSIVQEITKPEHSNKMYIQVYKNLDSEPDVFIVPDEMTHEEIQCVLSKEQKDIIRDILLIEVLFHEDNWVRSKML